jgi:hypothetical protein
MVRAGIWGVYVLSTTCFKETSQLVLKFSGGYVLRRFGPGIFGQGADDRIFQHRVEGLPRLGVASYCHSDFRPVDTAKEK